MSLWLMGIVGTVWGVGEHLVSLAILGLVLVVEHGEVALVAGKGDAMLVDGSQDGTAGLVGVGAVAKAAVGPDLEYLAEVVADLGLLHVISAEALDARSVNDVTSGGEVEELAEGGGVLPRVMCGTDLGSTGLCFGYEAVEQGALAHTAVSAQECHFATD